MISPWNVESQNAYSKAMIYFDEFIEGDVKAQPRARAVSMGKRARMYNPNTADKWKLCVKNAVSGLQLGSQPLSVSIHIRLKRPKSHYGSRKGQSYLKDSAPEYHTQTPDVDNLAKAMLDAITDSGAWDDDKQVVSLLVSKTWSKTSGATLIIEDLKHK